MKTIITESQKEIYFDIESQIHYWDYNATYLILFKKEHKNLVTEFGDWDDIKKNNVFFIKRISKWAKLDNELCCNLDNLHLKVLTLKWCEFEPSFVFDDYKNKVIFVNKHNLKVIKE